MDHPSNNLILSGTKLSSEWRGLSGGNGMAIYAGCTRMLRVDRGHRMGQRADGDEVHAGFGVGANVGEVDAARSFQRDLAVELSDALDGLANLFRRHVVEQDGFGAMLQRLLEFFQRAHFDFDRQARCDVWLSAVSSACTAPPASAM